GITAKVVTPLMPRTFLSVRTGRSLGRRSSDMSWRMLELAGTNGDLYFLQTSILTLLTSSLDGFSRARSRSRISVEICSTTWLIWNALESAFVGLGWALTVFLSVSHIPVLSTRTRSQATLEQWSRSR